MSRTWFEASLDLSDGQALLPYLPATGVTIPSPQSWMHRSSQREEALQGFSDWIPAVLLGLLLLFTVVVVRKFGGSVFWQVSMVVLIGILMFTMVQSEIRVVE